MLSIFCESGVKKMANIKSAKKRISVIQTKTAKNRRVKEHIKSVTKNFEKALAEGDMATAQEKLRLLEKKLDKAAAKNIIHKNKAARKASRLTKRFNEASAK